MSEEQSDNKKPNPTSLLEVKPADVSLRDRLVYRQRLWARGNLSWMFGGRPWQKKMYEFVRSGMGAGAAPYLMMLAHRRSGKSSCGLIIGIEECLRNPGSSVAIVCKTKEQARSITDEAFAELLKDCPKSVQPRRIKNDFAYLFANGSKIVILAADRLSPTYSRGRKFRFILITEAAFIHQLPQLISSVLAPTLGDVTGQTWGTMLLESTPPDETVPEDCVQDFIKMWQKAQLDNRALFLPLSKNPDADERFCRKAEIDSGGKETIPYRREYECEFIVSEDTTAVPEFTLERAFRGNPEGGVLPLVREVVRPPRADRYCSMDIGGSLDLWALLWGWYWFEKDILVVEDEALLANAIGLDIAKEIEFHEKAIWPGIPGGKLNRVADNSNSVLLDDLWRVHGLHFYPTQKDHKDAQLNLVRTMVREGRIVIHPRCKHLINTLRIARRAPTGRRTFARTKDIGHADLLDSLIYMCRNISRHEIPEDVRPPVITADIRPMEGMPKSSGQKLQDLLIKMRNTRLRAFRR